MKIQSKSGPIKEYDCKMYYRFCIFLWYQVLVIDSLIRLNNFLGIRGNVYLLIRTIHGFFRSIECLQTRVVYEISYLLFLFYFFRILHLDNILQQWLWYEAKKKLSTMSHPFSGSVYVSLIMAFNLIILLFVYQVCIFFINSNSYNGIWWSIQSTWHVNFMT